MAKNWKSVDGDEILRLMQNGQVALEIPEVAGIYAWRLNLDSSRANDHDHLKIISNINSLMTLPLGEIGPRHLNHSVNLLGLRLNGKKLPDQKSANLVKFMQRRPGASKFIQDYVSELSDFLPNLYVGNTENLAERVVQHVNGTSDFGKTVNGEWGRDFKDLTFHFFEVKNAPKEILEGLEFIAQSLTVSAFTKRAG